MGKGEDGCGRRFRGCHGGRDGCCSANRDEDVCCSVVVVIELRSWEGEEMVVARFAVMIMLCC